jgi:hypothetical protein
MLVVMLFAITAFAADVTGKWSAEVPGRDGQTRTQTFNLKADGDKLTGTVSGMGGEREITNGKVSGDTITFDVKFEAQGNSRTMNYTGKVSGGEIKFNVTGGQRNREFTAKRATS